MVSTVGNRGVRSNGLGGGLICSAIKFILYREEKSLNIDEKKKYPSSQREEKIGNNYYLHNGYL
jgi:hypothetical protein